MRRSHGYTAIELLVSVAASAVVLTLIVVAVRTYAIRNQVATGVQAAQRWSAVVETRFQVDGRVPRTWQDVAPQIDVPSEGHIEKLVLVDGRIDIVFGRDAAGALRGQHVSLTPYQTADREVIWICGNDEPGLGLEPLGFVDGGTQPRHMPATVADRYLPAECR
jgi:hypothetical protein